MPSTEVTASKSKSKAEPNELLKGFSSLQVASSFVVSSNSNVDQKLALLQAIKCAPLTSDESSQLRQLLDPTKSSPPIAYDGFEPSGRVTLAHGLLRVLNAKRLLDAGCVVRFWVADVFALLNNKFGGDLKKISSVSNYMVEVWKSLGLDMASQPNFQVLLASQEIAAQPGDYWSRVLDVANQFTVERVQQCAPIMGRRVDDPVANTNRVLYPMMQCADGFLLHADIYQMGADQEEGHKLVQEYIAQKQLDKSPVFLSHPLLLGLKQGQFKMSTSDPESAIYMDDTAPEVNTKLKKAYCPPGDVTNNPILDYMKYLVFPSFPDGITIERSEKNGGNTTYKSFAQLEADYAAEQVHPGDLKPCLGKYINQLLEPVRQHFAQGELKKMATNIKKLKVSLTPDGDKIVNLSIAPCPDKEPRDWKESTLSLEERFEVCRSVGEECIQDEDLRGYLAHKPHPICYDGFEPSGRMHIAQGVLRTVNVNKLTSTGAIFRFWVADWFAMLNNKMGGDLDKIRTVGRYMVEIWKSTGMDMTNVQFLWASDEILAHAATYWLRVMDVARRMTIARLVKCCTIMGRKEGVGMPAAQIVYPLMQCSDIFFLRADICQLGLDQRKINMLARDYCDMVKLKFKPVVLSHHMLMGLKQGQEKMSKSDPESAIFMEDAVEDVIRKVQKAYCPAQQVDGNPVLDYMKHIIFQKFATQGVEIRTTTSGGEATVLFHSYQQLEDAFVAGHVQVEDLKTALSKYMNEILAPVREHFSKGEAKKLLEQVRSFRITR